MHYQLSTCFTTEREATLFVNWDHAFVQDFFSDIVKNLLFIRNLHVLGGMLKLEYGT